MSIQKRGSILPKKSIGGFIVLMLVLSFIATLPSSAIAQEPPSYTNVTPEQAYNLMQQYSSDDLILDVRNESECTFNHLYASLQIPCYLLEHLIEIYNANPNASIIDYRSVELMAHIDDPIFVYCGSGSRSQIACTILAENGFTEVYNIMGGMGAWLQASLPMYDTTHEIRIVDEEISIDPLLISGCKTCGQGARIQYHTPKCRGFRYHSKMKHMQKLK